MPLIFDCEMIRCAGLAGCCAIVAQTRATTLLYVFIRANAFKRSLAPHPAINSRYAQKGSPTYAAIT